jgi:class 3 adenylate cyclase
MPAGPDVKSATANFTFPARAVSQRRRRWMMDASLDPVAAVEWLAALFPVRPPRRRPLTLMFTDIAGFTAHAAAFGDRAAVRLVHAHDAAVLPAIRRHSGRVLKRLGDGLMAAFGSPAAAVNAALEIQRAARRVRLRIGIHAGAARVRSGDLIGHEVNVAARIGERALGGEILVSDAVRAAVGALPARFRAARPLLIAGRKPERLFRVHGVPCQTGPAA